MCFSFWVKLCNGRSRRTTSRDDEAGGTRSVRPVRPSHYDLLAAVRNIELVREHHAARGRLVDHPPPRQPQRSAALDAAPCANAAAADRPRSSCGAHQLVARVRSNAAALVPRLGPNARRTLAPPQGRDATARRCRFIQGSWRRLCRGGDGTTLWHVGVLRNRLGRESRHRPGVGLPSPRRAVPCLPLNLCG